MNCDHADAVISIALVQKSRQINLTSAGLRALPNAFRGKLGTYLKRTGQAQG
jgi:hypothetical protein